MRFSRDEALAKLAEAVEWVQKRQDLFTTMMIRLAGLRALRKHIGFEASDQAVQEAHRRLQAVLAPGDWLGRVSEEDFLVVSFDCNSPSCAIKGGRSSLQALLEPVHLDGLECDLQPHAGIAVFPGDGRTPEALLRHAMAAADQAYELDTDPRYAFFCKDLGQRARDDFVLQQALRRAISKGEFCLFLQPKFNLVDHQLIGAEALIRWPQPDGSLLSPGAFIPVLERGRLMRPLGRWVFDETVPILQAWRDSDLAAVPIAMNVAADQLSSDDWLTAVQAQVEAGQLRPAELMCEITESVALSEGEATTARLRRLHELGFRISVDDFGVGYSNLAALARFPFNEVKIDRSLVAGLGTDDSRQTICRAAATLGRDLGMSVLAEGIETQVQERMAAEIGCDRTQGFLFGRPVPVAEFEATWLGGERRWVAPPCSAELA